jgi:hypothetical protein
MSLVFPSDDLPEGWKKVESRSRKGEVSYENIYTGGEDCMTNTTP